MNPSTLKSSPAGRDRYLDVVKALLTVLVVAVHAAVTYGAAGSWFFEDPVENFPTSVALSFFNIYCQSFFMGLFFFISGLFTPRSIERKGPARFVLDRLVRLGIPLVVFFFLVNPLTEYGGYLADYPGGIGLMPFLRHGIRTLSTVGTGPLWFVQTLLAFSILAALAAAAAPSLVRRAPAPASPRPLRSSRTFAILVAVGIGVGAISFLVRQRFPLMTMVSNLQIGFFTQYVVYFALGVAAGRRGFFERLMNLAPRPWCWTALGCALALPVILVGGGALENGLGAFTTGITWQALAFALWEQVTAVVFSMALLLFARRRFNSPGPLARIACRNAYVTYVFHAPVLVWLGYAGIRLVLPPAVKWVLLTVAGIAVTLALGELVLKRIPGVRRVLY